MLLQQRLHACARNAWIYVYKYYDICDVYIIQLNSGQNYQLNKQFIRLYKTKCNSLDLLNASAVLKTFSENQSSSITNVVTA